MMNVDDAIGVALDQVLRNNLHVARQHDEVRTVVVNQSLDSGLGPAFVFLRDRNHGVRDFVEVSSRLTVGMVGNDQWDVAGRFAALMAEKQVREAVAVL